MLNAHVSTSAGRLLQVEVAGQDEVGADSGPIVMSCRFKWHSVARRSPPGQAKREPEPQPQWQRPRVELC